MIAISTKLHQFSKDYRLPITTSLVFLAILASLLLVRFYERSVLAEILPGTSLSGKNYADLLSGDKAEGVKKNEVANEDEPKQQEAKKSDTGSTSSFTVSTSGSSQSTGTTPPQDGGGATEPPSSPPASFTSEVLNVRQKSSVVDCGATSGPGGSTSCYKRYVFSGTIRMQNGPGTVNYGWYYGPPMIQENNSFSAGSGETFNERTKEVTLPCNQPGPYNIALFTSSPSQSSKMITINHSC